MALVRFMGNAREQRVMRRVGGAGGDGPSTLRPGTRACRPGQGASFRWCWEGWFATKGLRHTLACRHMCWWGWIVDGTPGCLGVFRTVD